MVDTGRLGELMGEYDGLLQEITQVSGVIGDYTFCCRELVSTLTSYESFGGGKRTDLGKKNYAGKRSWRVDSDGNLVAGFKESIIARGMVGDLIDALQRLSVIYDRKLEVDGELKAMGYESLIRDV